MAAPVITSTSTLADVFKAYPATPSSSDLVSWSALPNQINNLQTNVYVGLFGMDLTNLLGACSKTSKCNTNNFSNYDGFAIGVLIKSSISNHLPYSYGANYSAGVCFLGQNNNCVVMYGYSTDNFSYNSFSISAPANLKIPTR
jgi:hypothetical protein